MTDRFWPILGLDEGATEAEVRRAYAKRLREQGPEADVASFQALRAEFEEARAAGEPALAEAKVAIRSRATRRVVEDPVVRRAEPETLEDERPRRLDDERLRRVDVERPPRLDEELPQQRGVDRPPRLDDTQRIRERSSLAVAEIRQLLADGYLVRACDRFDSARATNEIDFHAESQIELELARHWLANGTLDATALAAIVGRYRWDDVWSDFSLGPQVVARLRREAAPAQKPGERFIGKWNWGAFALTPFWMMTHGLWEKGIGILVVGLILLVVPLGPLAILGIAIHYGRRGNALAVKHRRFSSENEFVAVQNAWRNWGLSLWAVMALCLGVLVVVGARSG
jgi:hypothetical protein